MVKDDQEVDILEVVDRVLSAALRELRSVRARRVPAVEKAPGRGRGLRMSQTRLCLDILKEAGRPLHVKALLSALESLGIQAHRESLVSAISKKLAPRGPFVRTARNTFGLAGRDAPEEA